MRRASRALVCLWMLIVLATVAGCMPDSGPFTDDFSDPASGWGAASHETYVRGYQQGRYLIQIDVPRWFVWATAGRRYEDVDISTVVRTLESLDNHFGVLCRYTDGGFYYFAISADGYYAIFLRTEEGELLPLTGRAMLHSPAIRTDGSENRLRAICKGTQLTLFVNGTQVAQVEDNTLQRGDVGLAGGTVSQGGTIIWFDDYTVQKP